jgi:hypothetical protein
VFETFYLIATVAAFGGSLVVFVVQRATTYASLWTLGWSGVLAFGSLNLEVLDGGSAFTYASEPLAILWAVNALAAFITFVASVAGAYPVEDDSSDSLSVPDWRASVIRGERP